MEKIPPRIYLDPALDLYATDRQKEVLKVYRELLSVKETAEFLGITHQSTSDCLTSLLRKAKKYGFSPESSYPTLSGRNNKIRPINTLRDIPVHSNSLLWVPDTQIRPDIDYSFIFGYGMYAVHKKPRRIVVAGDWADMSSLSSYDRGKRSYEGARYKNDIESSISAMKTFLRPIGEYNKGAKKDGRDLYLPELYMLEGNHEYRITRATEVDPMLFGTISLKDLKFEEFGFTVVPFLEVLKLDGIAFSHYFRNGNSKFNSGFSTAQLQLNKMHMSCVAGHQQGFQMATGVRADGKRLTSIIAGSSYDYNLEYMGPQGNNHWRGILMLHNISDGEFDLVQIPVEYIKRKYLEGVSPMYFSPKE